MASARPVIVSGGAFVDLLAGTALPLVGGDDPASVSERMVAVANASPELLNETGLRLRSRVEQGHSLATWGDNVVAIVSELHQARAARRR